MKNIFTLFTILIFSFYSSAQVLCIKCYNQNARVLTDTNNLISNGGFENTTCRPCDLCNDSSFCPNSQHYHCDIANWTCTGGGINTYAHVCNDSFAIIVEGIKAVYFGNAHAYACSASIVDTSCVSNDGCGVMGSIPVGYPLSYTTGYGGDTGVSLSQTVNGLTTGSIYILEFWAGGEEDFINEGLFAVDVGFGNTFLRDPVTPPDSGIGTRYVIIFTADSTAHTIKFTNWGHIYQATELVLDDVRLFAYNGSEGDACAAGINEVTENGGVSIFPNPIISEELTLTYSALQAPAILTIINVTGQEVARYQLPQFSSVQHLKLPPMASGIYVARLIAKDGGVSRRFVKE